MLYYDRIDATEGIDVNKTSASKVHHRKVIKCGDIEIKKETFHQHKRPISIKSVDINKIVVSNKVPFGKKGFKYFFGYKDPKKK